MKYENDTKQIDKSTIQTPKLMSQNQSRRIISRLIVRIRNYKGVLVIYDSTTRHKILMSQLCQPMFIHSHRIVQSNKQSTFESPKLKRYCLNLDNHHLNIIKQQNYKKKVEQVNKFQKETQLCHPYKRIKRKHNKFYRLKVKSKQLKLLNSFQIYG
ncbi:unnamed protein product [Paramecium primaurelia]|uniref:Uncharacterized protein n=1 Tax=Paramecium primaurelia TaxID=5886 RepID=A0A8S1PV01_PARPR|nr:unnamed protein product [Paramecium primaurelia]